ncbi:MAG: hypothetical protein U0R50_00990 [Gaiellales bacterium]
MNAQAIIDRGSTVLGRRFASDRVRLALAIAAVEAILVVLGVVAWWAVIVFAAGATALAIWLRQEQPTHPLRPVVWVAAVSQLFVVAVPVIVTFILGVVTVVVVVAAIAALFLLLRDR